MRSAFPLVGVTLNFHWWGVIFHWWGCSRFVPVFLIRSRFMIRSWFVLDSWFVCDSFWFHDSFLIRSKLPIRIDPKMLSMAQKDSWQGISDSVIYLQRFATKIHLTQDSALRIGLQCITQQANHVNLSLLIWYFELSWFVFGISCKLSVNCYFCIPAMHSAHNWL